MIITSIIVTWIPCSREISPWVSFYRLCPATPIVGELEALSRLPPASPTSGERFKQTDSNRLSFGRPCGVQTILSLPLCLVEGGARAHTHTHTHTQTHRQRWILISRLNLLVLASFWCIQKKEDKPQTPRHLSSLTVILCTLAEPEPWERMRLPIIIWSIATTKWSVTGQSRPEEKLHEVLAASARTAFSSTNCNAHTLLGNTRGSPESLHNALFSAYTVCLKAGAQSQLLTAHFLTPSVRNPCQYTEGSRGFSWG